MRVPLRHGRIDIRQHPLSGDTLRALWLSPGRPGPRNKAETPELPFVPEQTPPAHAVMTRAAVTRLRRRLASSCEAPSTPVVTARSAACQAQAGKPKHRPELSL